MVCRPKDKGGLGILNLQLQNKALLMKQLHKFYTKQDVPWVHLIWSLYGDNVPHACSKRGSFWWKDIFSFVNDYRAVTQCVIGDGSSVLFWKDFWVDGTLLCDKFPRLFSFATSEDVSVAAMYGSQNIFSHFMLPISVEAYQELQDVSAILVNNPIDADSKDQRILPWGNGSYAPSKFYKFCFAILPSDNTCKAIWKSRMLPKLKVFCWLLFHDRLNTLDIMDRKQWQVENGFDCVLCNSYSRETRDHLFFGCQFAHACWEIIGIHWDLALPISSRILAAKQIYSGPCFMEILACGAWNIWKMRNDFIFNGLPCSLARWRVKFQSDLMLHQYRVKAELVQPLIDWLQNL
jgi:hypothetical protein